MQPTDNDRLDARIPEKGFSDPDEALDAFLGWVSDRGLTLYAHQEQAILEIFAGNHVILDAPTGSGKSLVATAMHFMTFCALGRAYYTAPIKALVNEKFFELCRTFGPEHVGMITGDSVINADAPIVCCTAEILSDMALRQGALAKVDSVVMDEFHYYGDRDRGMAWQVPLLRLSSARFLLMSGTLGDTSKIQQDLEARTHRKVAEVQGVHRPVPLRFEYSMRPLTEAIDMLVRQQRAPVYLVHFSQREATEQAQALMSVDYCTKDEKRAIADALKGHSFQSPFGPTLRRYLAHGLGLHHAGLLPRYRLLVESLAQRGLLKVICGTDTLGVGINVPIRSVLFTKLCKFDGEQTVILAVRDFLQIAGRAGRAGFDTEGFVVVQAPAHVIDNARAVANAGTDAKKLKRLRKSQPPDRGYKHWDEQTFEQLTTRRPEALTPQLNLTHGHLLSVLQASEAATGGTSQGMAELSQLIEHSHQTQAQRSALLQHVQAMQEQLMGVGVLQLDGEKLLLDPTLPKDFALHHPLSLLLVDAVGTVELTQPGHALKILTWVESILEHPRPVLIKQRDKARFDAISALKAQGVPYEERMERLEEVDYPKPEAEHLYAWFNTYAEKHPWVKDHPIRPKSVARDILERFASFNEYVRELGLERMEGVLLRYLSEAYKALVQGLPPEIISDELDDLRANLRATLAVVDDSLITEWERMMGVKAGEAEPPKVDISAHPKQFTARVRAELHAFVRALALQDWDEAAACFSQAAAEPPDPAQLQRTIAPFEDEFGLVAFDHRARMGPHTQINKVGPHQWRVRQRVLPRLQPHLHAGYDPDEEEADQGTWALEAEIDLRADTNPEGPLLRFLALAP